VSYSVTLDVCGHPVISGSNSQNNQTPQSAFFYHMNTQTKTSCYRKNVEALKG